jgi:ABC-type polysaccharide/polyol phosphate transport system ATPase subunit
MARVVLENVRVDFPIYATQRNLRTAIFNRATGGLIQRQGKQGRAVVEALAGVSMTFEDGDRIGLIGHNGSGKSTLLKVLAGIYEPIEGRLLVEGQVTPLFDMMPGLDPEDSGYENIVTCGLLLGLSRDEIESKIPNVEEFCELGEYLALPVRTYSTGMMMRLGFALVTAIDPGVLLMDEGIGAGDARFTERAEKRLKEFVGRSRILVLASHSNTMIKSMCNKAALLQAGRLVAFGSVDEVFEQYNLIVSGPNGPAVPKASPSRPLQSFGRIDLADWKNRTWHNAGARIEWAELTSDSGIANNASIYVGGNIRVTFGVRFDPVCVGAPIKLSVTLTTNDGTPLANMVDEDSQLWIDDAKSIEVLSVALSDIRFYPGTYFVGLWVGSTQSTTWDHVHDCIAFKILSGGKLTHRELPRETGLVFLTPMWTRG